MSRTVKRLPDSVYFVKIRHQFQNWEDQIVWGETLYGPYSSLVAARREADDRRPTLEDQKLNDYYRSLGEFVGPKEIDILEAPVVFSSIEHTEYKP